LRNFVDLSFEVPSAGNPSRVQADIYEPGRGLLKRWRTMGKVLLVPNSSYLFYVGTETNRKSTFYNYLYYKILIHLPHNCFRTIL